MIATKTIALVGRPNVGKSRLFNRLSGRRISIVHDQPGVTRDIISSNISGKYTLLDTGGIGLETNSPDQAVIAGATEEQVEVAVTAADLILLVVDGLEGSTYGDQEVAERLRKFNKPVFLLVNKIDLDSHEERVDDFSSLGFKDIFYVSAEHGRGISVLEQSICTKLNIGERIKEQSQGSRITVKICFVGRPNAGKSSISNRLINSSRMIVSDVPGTTRDSVEVEIRYPTESGEDLVFQLKDTAGVRNRNKVNTSLDYFSTLRTHQAIEDTDLVFLVVDALAGIGKVEKKLAGEVIDAGKCLAILVNKWDIAQERFNNQLVEGYENIGDFAGHFLRALRKELFFLPDSPVFFISAKTGYDLEKVLKEAHALFVRASQNLPTSRLNKVMSDLVNVNQPRFVGKRLFKLYYAVQVGNFPFKIRLFCNRHGKFEDPYRRYLEKGFHQALGLQGCPTKFEIKGRSSSSELK